MAGKNKFACEECPYAMNNKGTFRKHVTAVHEKAKPHKCQKCPYASFTNRDLQRHVNGV